MKYFRAFIAGMVLPSILVPFFMIVIWATGRPILAYSPFFMLLPWVWGLWNVAYFAAFKDHFPGSKTIRLLLTGALLGLLIALFGVFIVHMPEEIGLPMKFHLMPLLGAPIVYAILWRYLVDPLNGILGLARD